MFLDVRFQAVTLTVGFKPVARRLPDAKLKPKIRGDYCAWTAGYCCQFSCGFEQFKQSTQWTHQTQLFAQVQLVDHLFVTISFRFAQIIEQTSALRDHLKKAATRRMIFPIGLEVFRQMLDPTCQKCDLHVRAAGIVVVQLELLKTDCFVALCHNEAPILDEEPFFATEH
jgi:hypothetical protein